MKRIHASNREDIRDTLLGALTVAIFFAAAALEGAAYQAEQEAFRAKAAEDFKCVEVAMGYKRESRFRNARRRTSLERRRRK